MSPFCLHDGAPFDTAFLSSPSIMSNISTYTVFFCQAGILFVFAAVNLLDQRHHQLGDIVLEHGLVSSICVKSA